MKLAELSLATRIMFSAVVLLVAVASAFILWTDQHEEHLFLAKRNAELANSLRLNDTRLRQSVDTLRQDTVFLAHTPPITGIIRATLNQGYDPRDHNTQSMWEKRLQEIFAAFCMAHPSYFQVRYLGIAGDGREIVRVERKNGKIIVTPHEQLQSKGDRDYFKATLPLREHEVYLSEINLNRERGKVEDPHVRTLRASTPVFSPDGKLFGMVVINMDAGPLLDSTGSGLPADTQMLMTNTEGDFLVHPVAANTFGFDLGRRYRWQDAFPALTDKLKPGNEEPPQLQEFETSAGRQYAITHPIRFDPLHPDRFWLLAYTFSQDTVEEQDDVGKVLAGTVLASGIVMGALLLILRISLTPLRRLTEAAAAIADGHYDTPLPAGGGGEAGALTQAFRLMLERIREREGDLRKFNEKLEKRVMERTAELQVKDERLDEAMRIGGLAYWECHLAERRIHVDEHFLAVLHCAEKTPAGAGYSREEFVRTFLDEQDAPAFIAALDLAAELGSGKFNTLEIRMRCGDGKSRWMSVRFRAVRDEASGMPLRLTGSIQDVNDRLKAEADLRLAASVFHNTMEGVVVTDASATILSVNPAFTDITGYTAEEAIGNRPSLLRSDHHGPEFYQEMWEILLRDGHWQGEIWNRRKNGEVYLEWLTINMIPGSDGKPSRYVSVFNDITELRRKDAHIRHLAYHDALTSLPNRLLLLDRLTHSISLAQRDNQRLGVMFIDLDHFKTINDTLGHEVGDRLLQEVAKRLAGCLRRSDTVARMGGDEFVVLLDKVEDAEDCAVLAEKILAALTEPMLIESYDIQVGASVGIALYPDDGDNATDLMKNADTAMYQAKSAGRRAYRFFQPAMTDQAMQRLKLEIELRHALQKGELELYYQPKLCLTTHSVFGMEALVRWNHPELGLVPPSNFIPLAEETGLILELGNWVLEEACRQAAAWQKTLGRFSRIAVNISAKQLQQGDLVERIAGLAQDYGLAPHTLEIEVTESDVMANPEQAAEMLGRLRDIGITVAVDDFGTGYSSLAYLRRLPLDVLKIDRSFVMNADKDEEDAQIVRTILALGNALKFTIVAEGVETESQADLLRNAGCKVAQGYLFSRPLPAAAMQEWLAARPLCPAKGHCREAECPKPEDYNDGL